jgi:hypothetical protein
MGARYCSSLLRHLDIRALADSVPTAVLTV